MNMRYIGIFLAASLLASFQPAIADDTDLFVRADGASLPPDVLFVIDNAANFSASASASNDCIIDGSQNSLHGTVGGIEQCALYKVISELDPDTVNIGIMVYNANNVVNFQGVACFTIVSSKPGGCLVYPMQLMSAANKTTLLAWIATWKTTGSGAGYIKANSEATGGSMQEAWAYYNGRTGLSGTNYSSTLPPTTCNKYVIFIGNSFNNSGLAGRPDRQRRAAERARRHQLDGRHECLPGRDAGRAHDHEQDDHHAPAARRRWATRTEPRGTTRTSGPAT